MVIHHQRQPSARAFLMVEMMVAMAEGLPLLTTVASSRLEAWLDYCGGLSELLPADAQALWRWWNKMK